MKAKSNDKVKIPRFSSDKEALEWYESHDITEHLEDTEEIKPDNVIYQDSKGLWYRASDGIQVPSPKQSRSLRRRLIREQIRIIHEAPLKEVFVICDEVQQEDDQSIIIEKEGDVTWTSTSLSSAIMQK